MLVGKKALEIGANAVLGYSHSFDMEGDSGIVSRGSGALIVLYCLLVFELTGAQRRNRVPYIQHHHSREKSDRYGVEDHLRF